MKFYITAFVLMVVVTVEGWHTFVGTNIQRPLVYHQHVKYNSMMFRKRIENIQIAMPNVPYNYERSIQGILAFDLTNSGATANVTQGGLGFKYVNLRMKSDRGMRLHYDVYVFA